MIAITAMIVWQRELARAADIVWAKEVAAEQEGSQFG